MKLIQFELGSKHRPAAALSNSLKKKKKTYANDTSRYLSIMVGNFPQDAPRWTPQPCHTQHTHSSHSIRVNLARFDVVFKVTGSWDTWLCKTCSPCWTEESFWLSFFETTVHEHDHCQKTRNHTLKIARTYNFENQDWWAYFITHIYIYISGKWTGKYCSYFAIFRAQK